MSLKFEQECLVFSTSLRSQKEIEQITEILNTDINISDWSVDLDNWESVLRVVGRDIDPSILVLRLREQGVLIRQMSTC